jgi:phosphoadenosine phosphosulfate reductase
MDLDLTTIRRSLADASPQEILTWAASSFYGDIAVSSSFQTQSVPLLHMIATTAPNLPILFIDTGYHFPETIAFRDHLARRWDLRLEILKANPILGDSAPPGGQPLYMTNPDLCCDTHKVAPLREAMRRYPVLVSGIRRDQSEVRAEAQVVEATGAERVRIHPLLDWTHADVARYAKTHNLPQHPLTVRGYTSIGCLPCTRPPAIGADLRSGRWQGTGKTECGLHTKLRDLSKGTKT